MHKNPLLKETGEFSLIKKLELLNRNSNIESSSLIAGIGDDAAVVEKDSNNCLLITADSLVENIHFSLNYTTAFMLGKKCLAVNLSDIAAMGGNPLYYLVCLCAPAATPLQLIQDIYAGMKNMANKYSLLLVGGDTVASDRGITISITIIGEAKKDRVVFRHGAKKGDHIFVTGYPGDSALGLEILRKGSFKEPKSRIIKKHISPVPRIEAGKALSKHRIASSMIDVSDGIASDMRHIMEQSMVGASIFSSSLKLSKSYRTYCSLRKDEEYFYPALCGGEDYELLFTAGHEKNTEIKALEKKLGIPITHIGEVTGNKGVLEIIGTDGKPLKFEKEGFAHFK